MSDIGKIMRMKRFNISDEHGKVRFVFETGLGNKYQMRVTNCSLTGLSGVLLETVNPSDIWELGTVIPASKLSVETSEFTLGRLILRRTSFKDKEVELAFSTIDGRIPIDGALSRYLKNDTNGNGGTYGFELNSEKFSLATFKENSHTNVDILNRCEQFSVFYKEWKESNKFQYYNIRQPSKGERINLKQRRKNGRTDYLVFCSNDYLGLATSPEVTSAAQKSIDQYGFGSTGSPVTTGLTVIHEELQYHISRIYKTDDVALFNSGYSANIGIINALTGAQDLVVADVLAHASIQDALQMSRATTRYFKHNDIAHLEKLLSENRPSHFGSLLITDGVFSMDGDIAPVDKLSAVAKKYNCRLMVDEAHALGVIGPTGLGSAERFPTADIDLHMGTFSKICGGIGGFVAGRQDVIDWIRFYGRAYMFSVSIPPSTAAAALAALMHFQANPDLVSNLQKNIRQFVSGLRHLGCSINAGHESAVIPVVIGDEKKLGLINEVFREEGVYVIPIVYPAVSRKQSRFRFTMMATHTASDIDYVLNVLEKAMLKAQFSFKKEESAASLSEIVAAA